MKTYEVINMSDHYTIQSDDFRNACIACLLLGEGNYGLKEVGGDEKMPIFIFGGSEKWIKDNFNCNVNELFESADMHAIADVLDSIVIGDRKDFESAVSSIRSVSARKAFIADWNDRKRSSMNDIGGRARKLAEIYRRAADKKKVKS